MMVWLCIVCVCVYVQVFQLKTQADIFLAGQQQHGPNNNSFPHFFSLFHLIYSLFVLFIFGYFHTYEWNHFTAVDTYPYFVSLLLILF